MKFYGQPNLYVRISNRYKHLFSFKGFYFNDKGEFETANERLIKLLKQQFKYEIETENNADTSEDIKTRHCKKCDFTCENQGELLAHYRKEHSKQEE